MVLSLKWRPRSDGYVNVEVDFKLKDKNGDIFCLQDSGQQKIKADEDVREYKVGGLGLELLVPFRKYRLKFRGYLRKNGSDDEIVYARIRLLWLTLSNTFDFKHDLYSSFFAKETARNNSAIFGEDRYEQFGQFKGTVQFENEPISEIYLWGSRCKKYLPKAGDPQLKYLRIYGYVRNGIGFNVGFVSQGSVTR